MLDPRGEEPAERGRLEPRRPCTFATFQTPSAIALQGSGVLAEADSFGAGAGVRVRNPNHASNPERTYSPTHIRPDLSGDPDPLHLAAAAAALDQDRGGGRSEEHTSELQS